MEIEEEKKKTHAMSILTRSTNEVFGRERKTVIKAKEELAKSITSSFRFLISWIPVFFLFIYFTFYRFVVLISMFFCVLYFFILCLMKFKFSLKNNMFEIFIFYIN